MTMAEKLGMTLTDLRCRMSMEELLLWVAFYDLRNDYEREATQKANKQRR